MFIGIYEFCKKIVNTFIRLILKVLIFKYIGDLSTFELSTLTGGAMAPKNIAPHIQDRKGLF